MGYSLDDLARGAPSPTSTTSTTAPTRAGGYSLDDLAGGGGATVQPRQAAATGGGGGGGLLSGLLHGAAHQVGEAAHIVGSIPAGLAHLGKDTAASVYNTGRTIGAATHLMGNPADLKPMHGESFSDYVTRKFPILSDLAQPTVNVARDVGGAGEAGLHLAHLDRGHAGLEHEAAQAWSQHPLGRLISDALGASVVLGPVDTLLGKTALGDTAAGGALGRAAAVSHAVAGAPLKPFELVSKIPTAAGSAAFDRVMAAQAAGERAPLGARLLQPMSPAFRDMAKTLREGEVVKQGELNAVARTARSANEAAPSPVAQQVAMGLAEGEAPALAHLRDAAPDKFDQFIADRYRGTLTPEAAHALADIGAGAHPEVLDQANAYLERLDAGMGSRGVGSLAALNDRYQAAHPEQAGFDPIMRDPMGDPNEITAAPSRLRPMLSANRAVNAALGEQGLLPTTAREAEAMGADARYMPHMQEGRAAKGAGQASGTTLPKLRTITSEHLRTGEPVYDRSIRGVARGMAEQTGKAADLRTAQQVTELPHVVRLNEGPLAGVRSVNEARAAGYVPWDPRALFETGSFRPLTPEQIAAGDLSQLHFIPKPLFDRFRNYFERKAPGPVGEAFDKGTRAFYKSTLHGTPYFAKMYALQNLGLAATRGDVSIGDMIRLAPKAIAAMRTGEFPELQGRLPIGDEAAPSTGRLGPLRKVGRAVTGGLPRVIDGFSRTLVAIDKIGKGASAEEAMLEANRTMGMYNAETDVGRAMIRRVFPIYPWARHVLTAMGEFAGDHPQKTMFLLNLGTAAANDEDLRGTPAFERGLLDLGGGKALDLRDLNPLSIFSGGAPTAFTNPLIRAGAGAGLGINVSHLATGRNAELTRPPDTSQHGPLNLAEAEHFIQGQTPLGHAFQSITEKPVARYDTGEPKFSGGKPIPRSTTQPYWKHLLGLPVVDEAPPTSPKLARKLKAIDKSKAKAAAKYKRERQRSGL